jgi:Ser/Thr protein kinase RdoA (MazF antagonist)
MVSAAGRRRFRFHDVDVAVSSNDAASLAWLEAFLAPPFETIDAARAWRDDVPGRAPAAAYEKRYVLDRRRFAALGRAVGERSIGDRPCFVLDGGVVHLPAARRGERMLLLDQPHGCVLIAGPAAIEIVADPAAELRRLPLLRAVREIAAAAWNRQPGRVQLHAAAFAFAGAVIALAGAKNAGKTTALAHALATPGARLVANDRLAVRLDGEGAVALGVPTIVSLRAGTFDRFPALLDGIPAAPYPWSLGDGEWRAARLAGGPPPQQRPVRLSPPRFAAQSGCNLAGGGRLAAILVCSLDSRVAKRGLTRLPPSEARAALEDCRYGLRPQAGDRTVIEAAVGAQAEDLAPSLDALAARLPVFAYRLGPRAYDEPFDVRPFLAAAACAAERDSPLAPELPAEVLGCEVIEAVPLSSSLGPGATPRVHRVALADGRVVKVRRTDEHVDAPLVARILAALRHPAFAPPLALHDGALIEEWIEGAPLDDPPGDDALAQAGDLLGRLHALESLDGLPLHDMAPTARELWRIEHDLEIVARAGALERETARRLLARAVECDPGAALTGVCHRDFCAENLIVDGRGRLRVVDNETVTIAALDFDLQRTAYRWALPAERWAVFLDAYRAHREPPDDGDAALFWRLRAVTLSASFRVTRGAPTAAAPLAELRRLGEVYAGRRSGG